MPEQESILLTYGLEKSPEPARDRKRKPEPPAAVPAMTVNAAKKVIVDALNALQRDGIWVQGIQVDWQTNVKSVDKPVLDSEIECSIRFEAKL